MQRDWTRTKLFYELHLTLQINVSVLTMRLQNDKKSHSYIVNTSSLEIIHRTSCQFTNIFFRYNSAIPKWKEITQIIIA